MAGGLSLAGLIGAASFAVTVMATPTPSDDSSETVMGAATPSAALLPMTETPRPDSPLAANWDRASLGVDSEAQSELLNRPYSIEIEIAPGDTLMSVLQDAGIDRPVAYRAIEALSEVFDPRGLRPKQTMEVDIMPPLPNGVSRLAELRFHPDGLRDVIVSPEGEGFTATESVRSLTDHVVRTDGQIDSSLYVAARDAGVPVRVLGSLINIFSFDVDFQREVQPGDRFSLMFSEKRTDDGETVDFGSILVAEMTVGGTLKRFYQFQDDDGRIDYYDAKGQSVRRALLRTPVEGARISSGFGKRKHPILGYTKMHKGLDFAAPSGTPIYAAGDGVVEAAGWNGGYGRYIRIRHNGTYSTAYAHLSRIDSRVKPGARVDQRQIIGYVGTSGRSTGPHLHYEVHVNGRQTNPLGVKLPTGKTLAGAELARFERVRAEIEQQYAAIEPRTQVAQIVD
ncbi:peptidoglycan DD-metalloendopeptidase family protein [Pacificispira sp.]|uniref:M23 family metallopeptidase n=1 Tax=Pacificispira sp. TaxID=2888761 RepID=UPI003BAA335B